MNDAMLASGRNSLDSAREIASLEEPNGFIPATRTIRFRTKMAASFLAGLILVLIHHFFYSYLDGKPTDFIPFASGNGSMLNSQSIVSIIGNSIAYAARTALSTAAGLVFIQVLWRRLRRQQYSVSQIDALMASKGDPFTLSALPAWYCAFGVTVIAFAASFMGVISIVSPGSLRIQSAEFSIAAPCTVQTVSLDGSDLATFTTQPSENGLSFVGAKAQLMGLAYQVLMTGSPLQIPSPCSGSCKYDITFDAPTIQCSPVDSSFNYSSWLIPPDFKPARNCIWTAQEQNSPSGRWMIFVTSDITSTSHSAAFCYPYNATYHATITHAHTSMSVVDVTQTDVHEALDLQYNTTIGLGDRTGMQYDAIISAFFDVLVGSVNYIPSLQEFTDGDNFFVSYSPSFAGSSGTPWASPPDLETVLPSLMQNISVSLLNSQLSEGQYSSAVPVQTTCYYTASTYLYDRARLLSTYGAALAITAVCIVFGFRAVHQNGGEESVAFSRILGAVLNKALFDERSNLSKTSKLTVKEGRNGRFQLAELTLD